MNDVGGEDEEDAKEACQTSKTKEGGLLMFGFGKKKFTNGYYL